MMLKFISDFLLLSHHNVIQKKHPKICKINTTQPERMSTQILKNRKHPPAPPQGGMPA
jgi:hypothetical protein